MIDMMSFMFFFGLYMHARSTASEDIGMQSIHRIYASKEVEHL
jgi:hypothetical protein